MNDDGPAVNETRETFSGALPEPVRLRVVSLAADALGALAVDHIPPSLRRVAEFAPARRAKVAGNQIAAILDSDDGFRSHIATQVRIVVPDLARALDEGAPPSAADPAEVAAVAYLLQPQGWTELIGRVDLAQPRPARIVDEEAVERLQRQLADARSAARADRDKLRNQLGEVKAENAELRRKLADARQRAKEAKTAREDSESAQAGQARALAGLEAEVRRLRSRITDLEATGSTARRAAREEREQATIRTRLLLETLVESVQGLRRELALPPVEGAPADTVNAAAPAAGSTARTTRARAVDDPALLEELLTLPRVHLIVDGYNVTKAAWPSTPLDGQRTRLLNGLAPVVARTRVEVTVVFDGADLSNPPPVAGPRGVRVMFSPPGVIADVTIADLVEAEPGGRPVVVVSSDREVADHAARAGARSVASAALVRLLTR